MDERPKVKRPRVHNRGLFTMIYREVRSQPKTLDQALEVIAGFKGDGYRSLFRALQFDCHLHGQLASQFLFNAAHMVCLEIGSAGGRRRATLGCRVGWVGT